MCFALSFFLKILQHVRRFGVASLILFFLAKNPIMKVTLCMGHQFFKHVIGASWLSFFEEVFPSFVSFLSSVKYYKHDGVLIELIFIFLYFLLWLFWACNWCINTDYIVILSLLASYYQLTGYITVQKMTAFS